MTKVFRFLAICTISVAFASIAWARPIRPSTSLVRLPPL